MEETHSPNPLGETIKRHLLDFDFEKVCSISCSNINVYCCLVCGRYFQGKGKNTYAYEHSLDHNHSLFMNLDTGKVYVLPENQQFQGDVQDIKYNLDPSYTREEVEEIGQEIQTAYNLVGNQYIRGVVGVNNLKNTDYFNVAILLLAHVQDIYSYFLLEKNKEGLAGTFQRLVKRIWNNKNFKGIVSPQEFLQKVSDESNKTFQIGVKSDPVSLLLWLLNRLDQDLLKSKSSFAIKKLFTGKLKVSSFKPYKNASGYEQNPSKVVETPFLMLSLDMPSEKEKAIQTTLSSLLSRYQAQTPHDTPECRKYYLITKYPKYLVLVLKRFTSNNFFKQKNSNIVQFPLQFRIEQHTYRLIANICHEGPVDSSVYKIYILRVNKWYLIQDLHIEESLPKEITISESYLQLYEKI